MDRKGKVKKMTRIDIISGFLGAGKTTLIQKLLKEALADSKVVLIENEFGEIGIDSGFLKEAGIEIKEMNSGCICCSLVGDFGTSLKEVLTTYAPERILIEPSGVGKLSDVIKAVKDVEADVDVAVNSAIAVVDAGKCKMYIKNFGEFFLNQIENAGTIILSRTDKMSEEKLNQCVELIREHNNKATIITTPWTQLDGKMILETMEGNHNLEDMLDEMLQEEKDHEHGEDCCCGHHHNHEDHEHHHEHGEGCCHEHHHEHGEGCCHGHHHDHGEHEHHHGHHHADEVFTSWGLESPVVYTKEKVEAVLKELEQEETYGMVLRAKGMVPSEGGEWIYFDYVPGESDIRSGSPEVTGKICVIGSNLKEAALEQLFR